MSLLAPAALAWLVSVPVLLWLWRLALTRRQVVIPSLAPFQHLLRRAPRSRTRIVVTLLFWLQLAAILAVVGAAARPVALRRPARTLLAILDTSASMQAGRAFAQARQALLRRVGAVRPGDQLLIVRTAPVGLLLPQATGDTAALLQAVRDAAPADLGGSLGAALRVGMALLPGAPDEILVLTDEPPPDRLEPPVRWMRVGRRAGNVAIVGVESQGPLCQPSDERAIVALQNYSDRPASVTVTAQASAGRELARAAATLAPGARQSVSLAVPGETSGWVRVRVRARPDALAVDNQAWLPVRRAAARPVLLHISSPASQRLLTSWLNACEALRWTADPGAAGGADAPVVIVTDDRAGVPAAAAGAVVLGTTHAGHPVASHWLASSGHPVAAYLDPVFPVTAALEPDAAPVGIPVIESIARGVKAPVAVTQEEGGRRVVRLLFDPASSPSSIPLLVIFFNSLRWVMGQAELPSTGRPFTIGGFAPGRVEVERPDGAREAADGSGGRVQYDRTTAAGVYRLTQGGRGEEVGVTFLDPLESNLLEPRSTWQPLPPAPAPGRARPSTPHPLAPWLVLAALLLLLAEWWRYTAPRSVPARPS